MMPDFQSRANHPSKPVKGDEEDYVDYIGRTANHWIDNPPYAPEGFHLVECGASPRHWPEYSPVDDDLYEGGCSRCIIDSQSEILRVWQCKAEHRRWKSWSIISRFASWCYVVGLSSTGGGTHYFLCTECGARKQHMFPKWRGKRSYFLWKPRDWWFCLLKAHHIYAPLDGQTFHMCAKCAPCPDCGSADPYHHVCGGR